MTGGSIHENGGLPKKTPQAPTFKSSDFLDFSQSLIFNQFKVLIFWIFCKYDFPISIFPQFLKVQKQYLFLLALITQFCKQNLGRKQQIKWFDIHFQELWNYLEHLFFAWWQVVYVVRIEFVFLSCKVTSSWEELLIKHQKRTGLISFTSHWTGMTTYPENF